MHVIKIKEPSHMTFKKMIKGHKVRIHPEMEGTGLILVVNPHNFDRITRTFRKMKGNEASLSPEEIEANEHFYQSPSTIQPFVNTTEDIQGEGIFHKLKLLKK